MATNNRLLSFYTLSLKLKLVCHLLFNGHKIFSQASLVILLQKRVFQFLIATSGVELCGDLQKLSRLSKSVLKTLALSMHCSKPEGVIKNWKTLFCSKITKEAWEKFLCPLNKR